MSRPSFTLTMLVTFGLMQIPAGIFAADPPPEVEFRSEDGQVLIAPSQIRMYDWATHVLTLSPGTLLEFRSKIPRQRLVSGFPFLLTIGGETIYRGAMVSSDSSASFPMPMIVVEPRIVNPALKEDQIQIRLGYPRITHAGGGDPRANPRFREALRSSGKLNDVLSPTDWISKIMREIKTLEPGMTRADVLMIFEEEGGISTPRERTYVHRECPYIKVEVTFKLDETNPGRIEAPEDRIAKISKPYLEWSIMD